MRAVFKQAAYVKRQPSWLARKIGEFLDWLADKLHFASEARRTSPVTYWTVLAIIVAVAIAVLARLWYVNYQRRKRGIAARPAPSGASIGFGRDPWTAAQQFAAAGDFTAAAHALYAALLSAIARRGLVRLHPSKTAGDYVRELRPRSAAVFGGFRDFARAYEFVVYGTGECDRERYERLQRLALPIVQVDG
ncbi:MAG TPA: DUF4129 domain-containing protein [Gemmatimonadaceae bacterium]|nr:DUF4129 domain-containing protein [Gemmatimonadaceae bacterium]